MYSEILRKRTEIYRNAGGLVCLITDVFKDGAGEAKYDTKITPKDGDDTPSGSPQIIYPTVPK